MIWLKFIGLAAAIIWAGRFLARYGDMLAEKTGMGRTWIGSVLVAATTSLPELFAGIGAVTVFGLPEIAVGDVLGSCMFNLFILSLLDAVGGPGGKDVPLSTRMGPGHALSIGFGGILAAIAGMGLVAGRALPPFGWLGVSTPALLFVYFTGMKTTFSYEQRLAQARSVQVAQELHYADVPLATALLRYLGAAAVVVSAALFLPEVGEEIAQTTGLTEGFVGALFIAMATSLPEASVSIAAVRMGSVDLAVGNVLGSNLFNLFILALDDLFYRPGPLLATVTGNHLIAVLAVLAMNGIVLIGLTLQVAEKRRLVAADTLAIAAVYAVSIVLYMAV